MILSRNAVLTGLGISNVFCKLDVVDGGNFEEAVGDSLVKTRLEGNEIVVACVWAL